MKLVAKPGRQPAAMKSGPGQPATPGMPLAQALGAEPADLALLGTLFETSTRARLGGATEIFGRLTAGHSLAQALRISKVAAEFLYARGHKWFAAGRIDRAESIFRALCIVAPDEAEFRVGLGICLRRREAWFEAREAFEMAARLRPDWPLPLFHKLELLMRREAWEAAAAALLAFEARGGAEGPPAFARAAGRYRRALEMRGLTRLPGKDAP